MTKYNLMKEFLEHKGEQWDPEKVIKDYEELQSMLQDLAVDDEVQEEGNEDQQQDA